MEDIWRVEVGNKDIRTLWTHHISIHMCVISGVNPWGLFTAPGGFAMNEMYTNRDGLIPVTFRLYRVAKGGRPSR